MLTEIFDKYSNYLINGSINWQTFQEKLAEIGKDDEINAQWDRYQIKKNPKEILKNAVINNDLSLAFDELDFNYPNAKELIKAINDLEKVVQSGDYVKLPEFKSLRIETNQKL